MDADSKYFHHGLLLRKSGRVQVQVSRTVPYSLAESWQRLRRSIAPRMSGQGQFRGIWSSCSLYLQAFDLIPLGFSFIHNKLFAHHFSDNNKIAFGYITCSGLSLDFTCGLMSIYTHLFITLRHYNQFVRYGCDWALLTLFLLFLYYFFIKPLSNRFTMADNI